MKTFWSRMKLALLVICLASLVACHVASEKKIKSSEHELITQELMTLVDHRPDVKKMLVESIERAQKINPDKTTNPVQTLEEYYVFIDWAAKAQPWNILPNLPESGLYEQIDQSLDYFYFINDQPLAELEGKGYYHNSLQYVEPYRSWLILFTQRWGAYLDTEASWNDEDYQRALANQRFGLQNGWYEDPSNWKTFNQFFARYLKSPDQRPIASPEDASVVTAPADSQPQGVWKIDDNSQIVIKDGIVIKSGLLTSVVSLIGADSPYKNAFAGGTLTHTFLDVDDYHRYHFPVGGTVREVRIIPADDAVGGILTWDAKNQKYRLEARTPDWQSTETRGCVIIETQEHGLVALLPIGMSQISSVNFEANIKPGIVVKKGEMLGYFLFGGSDFVMIFQKNAGFELTAPMAQDGASGRHLYMGEAFGKLKGPVK